MSPSQYVSIAYALIVIIGLTLEQFHYLPAGITNTVLITAASLHIGVMLPSPSTASSSQQGTPPTDSAGTPTAPGAGVHSPEVVQ